MASELLDDVLRAGVSLLVSVRAALGAAACLAAAVVLSFVTVLVVVVVVLGLPLQAANNMIELKTKNFDFMVFL
ncbi:MAG: hypothetical protein WKF70_11755 [Chitinophagaceae bacterium]